MDREAWHAVVHGVAKSWTWLSNWTALSWGPYSGRLKAGGEGVTEHEIVGWYQRLNGHEFMETPGDSEGQGSLVYFNPYSQKESDTTECVEQQPFIIIESSTFNKLIL